MTAPWRAFDVRYATLFRYRLPGQAQASAPLPGPSAIRLALVAAAAHLARKNSGDPAAAMRQALEAVLPDPDGQDLMVEMPAAVAITQVTVKRLKRTTGKTDDAAERSPYTGNALPSEECWPSGPFRVWIRASDRHWETIRHLLPHVRYLGTADSLCRLEPADHPGTPPEKKCARPLRDGAHGMPSYLVLCDLAPTVTLKALESRRTASEAYREVLWGLPCTVDFPSPSVRVFRRIT
jgi:hypothetical protein